MAETMTKQDRIEVLRGWVWKRYITKQKNLEMVCKQYGLDWYDDVLAGMEWNCCDRCSKLGDSTYDFIWLDYMDWHEDNPKDRALKKAIAKEKWDYCALCDDCIEELLKIGGYDNK